MRKLKLFFACLLMVVLSIGQVWAEDDVLNQSWSGISGTQYSALDQNAPTSDAHYKGNCAGGNSSIQLRSNNDNSGIVTTASGGKATKVVVVWNSSTQNGRTLNVYGKNTAYSAATDLYNNSNQGTLLGTIVYGTSTELDITDDYEYIGFRSASGAMYLTSVTITWESGSSTPSVSVNKDALNFGTIGVGDDVPAAQEFTITGSNLTSDLTVASSSELYVVSVKSGSSLTPSSGSVSATIVVTPQSGIKESAGTKSATITVAGGGLAVADQKTVSASTEVKAKHTVTWNNNGTTSTRQVIDGEKPVFPETPAACDASSTTFIGWATAPWDGKIANLSEKTVYTSAAEMPAVTGAVTYYAVFAKVAGESGWIETAIGDLGASDVFVIVGNNGSTYAMTNNNGTSSAPSASAVTISDGKISGTPAETIKWNISGNSTDGYTFYPNGDSDNWLYCTNTNNGVRVGTNTNKAFTISSGYLYNSGTSRYVGIYNSQDWRCYTGTGTNIDGQTFAFYKYSAGSASDYMTTCCTKYNITIADNIEHGSISADVASACEGTIVTITFSPAGGYHLDSWSLNGTAQDVNTNTFTMPDEAVTVSATFVHDDCTNLLAPTLDGVTKTYNSATIAWNTVTDAVAYAVSVVKDGEAEPVFSGNVNALSKALENLEPETQYNYSIMAIGDGTVKCADGNGLLEGNFTTEALPTAVLTLMENGNEVAGGSHAITVPFALPTAVTHTCGKTFVGWTSKSNFVDGDEALPSYYEKGAEFTFENTNPVTLYAVYADGGATEEKATVSIASYATANSWANGTQYTSVILDENVSATASWTGTGNKNTGKYYTNGEDWRFYQGESATITIATAVGELSSVKFTYSVSNTGILEDAEDNTVEIGTAVSASGTSAVYHVANSGTATNGQVRFTAIEVKYLKPGTLSNYSITCAAAPEAIVDPEVINATAEGVAAGIIEAAYDNVDEEHVSVALYNDEDCTKAFSGEWLEASINGDKNIAYTIAANTSYNDARVAYIKLTAPAEVAGPAPAVVVIPVSQVKKAPVFASIEELVAADVNANTDVTVSFSNVTIKSIYYYPNTSSEDNRKGVVFNIQKAGEDIKIYFNAKVSEEWVPGGTLSGKLTECPWKIYSDAWQLAPKAGWAWSNLTYTAPAAIESLEIRGNATKKTYIDGQAFDHAGLTAWAIYSDTHEEDVTTLATWTYDPAKLSESDTEVTVTATYAEQSDDETVTGLIVNPIPNKTIDEFIEAEGTRCYLEGIVGTIENTTYGNFYLTDASGTIYVYGCLTPSGESKKFADLGVEQGDQIKVIAEAYTNHATKGNEAVNVVFVSKKSPATMTFSDMALEFDDVETMAPATITLADASDIVYSIKVGSDDCVTISGDQITAKSVAGTATIVATLDETADYVGTTVEFVVTVTAPIVKYAITFDGNGADGGSAPAAIADKAEGEPVTLPANTYTYTGHSFTDWKVTYVDGESVEHEVTVTANAFTMPAYNVTVKAQWEEISVWAYTYTSNVELEANSNTKCSSEGVTISNTEYSGLRIATGSAAGSATITVPAHATKLHFHVAGWKDVNGSIDVKLGESTLATISLIADDGINQLNNNKAPYALVNDPIGYYSSVNIPDSESPTDIVFEAPSGKRAVIFGVNQVGGVLPVLQSLTISGDLENKTYEAGQSLNMTGLTVMGTYNVGDPIDVTDQVEDWLYDALEAGDESVTITAKIGSVTSAGYEISGLTVTDPTPTITASPSFVNFNSVEQGDEVAAKTITVTLTNVAAATVALSGAGASAFILDKSGLTESGTITITPNTAAVGSFSATITISDNASVAASATITVMMNVQLPDLDDDLTGTWKLVTDAAQLASGKKVIIAQYVSEDGAIKTMSTQANNNRTAVESTVAGTTLTPAEHTRVMTIEVLEDGKYALKTNRNTYLYAASSSGNNLKEQNTLDANGTWTITITDSKAAVTAQGSNTHKVMKYNESSDLFSCYTGGQKDIALYVLDENETADYELVRAGLIPDRHYSICLKKNITAVKGATFWSLTYKNEGEEIAYLVEEKAPFAAGKPYIYQATNDNDGKLEVVYGSDEVNEPVENGALRGTFNYLSSTALNGINVDPNKVYMLFNNELCPIGTNNHLDAYRAYVLYNELEPVSEAPQAPGRRVKGMPLHQDTATGIDALNASENPVKVLRDGQIFILRGEKMYDVTGQIVK